MSIAKKQSTISEVEYLAGEQVSEIKHEFIDGQVYAMTGAKVNHGRISGNVFSEFRTHLKGSPCEPLGPDMMVKVGTKYFYPDVIVDCKFDESQPQYTDSPILIVEVLSKSTSRMDRTTKRLAYINMPSVEEYVLIEQDFVDIEVMRKSDGWQSTHYFLGDNVEFKSIGLTLATKDIYERVNNQDMVEFLQEK